MCVREISYERGQDMKCIEEREREREREEREERKSGGAFAKSRDKKWQMKFSCCVREIFPHASACEGER